jgi:hypothetical protein
MKAYWPTLRGMTAVLQIGHKPRRAYSRLRLGIPARLLTLEGQQWVTLVDLSQTGARIVLGASGKVSGGLLRWLGFEAFGDPAWQAGEELALHFDEQIELDWLIETRQRAAVEVNGDLHARRAAREWVNGRAALGTER